MTEDGLILTVTLDFAAGGWERSLSEFGRADGGVYEGLAMDCWLNRIIGLCLPFLVLRTFYLISNVNSSIKPKSLSLC